MGWEQSWEACGRLECFCRAVAEDSGARRPAGLGGGQRICVSAKLQVRLPTEHTLTITDVDGVFQQRLIKARKIFIQFDPREMELSSPNPDTCFRALQLSPRDGHSPSWSPGASPQALGSMCF